MTGDFFNKVHKLKNHLKDHWADIKVKMVSHKTLKDGGDMFVLRLKQIVINVKKNLATIISELNGCKRLNSTLYSNLQKFSAALF